jgi:hypothetical protein
VKKKNKKRSSLSGHQHLLHMKKQNTNSLLYNLNIIIPIGIQVCDFYITIHIIMSLFSVFFLSEVVSLFWLVVCYRNFLSSCFKAVWNFEMKNSEEAIDFPTTIFILLFFQMKTFALPLHCIRDYTKRTIILIR